MAVQQSPKLPEKSFNCGSIPHAPVPIIMPDRDTQIKEILEMFNFEKVHKMMAAVNWYWFNSAPPAPPERQLRATAKALLEDCWNAGQQYNEVYQAEIGGFRAYYHPNAGHVWLELLFVAESRWTLFDNLKEPEPITEIDRPRRIDMQL